MKIIITNRDVKTIHITIESPYELRALYLLVKFAAEPLFRRFISTVDEFEDIPGLAHYCRAHIKQNPVKKIFNMLTGKQSEPTPTHGEKKAIITACLKAIREYNQQLNAFLNSEFFQRKSMNHFILRLLFDAGSRRKTLTRDEFYRSQFIQEFAENDEHRASLFDLYERYKDFIVGFPNIDPHYASNIIAIKETFQRLSNTINADGYIQSQQADISGISPSWRDTRISPSLLGAIGGAFCATLFTLGYSYYELKRQHDPNEDDQAKLIRLLLASSINISIVFTVMFISKQIEKRKQRFDRMVKNEIIEEIASRIGEFHQLLEEKGFEYQKDDITHIELPESSQPLRSLSEPHGFMAV